MWFEGFGIRGRIPRNRIRQASWRGAEFKPAAFPAAIGTTVRLILAWPPMPRVLTTTTRTERPPFPIGHFCIAASFRFGADALADSLPFRAMAGFQSSQSMGNLVQNAIANGRDVVGKYEINRKLDAAVIVPAKAHRSLCAVERKGPIVEPLFVEQFDRKLPDERRGQGVLVLHAACRLLVSLNLKVFCHENNRRKSTTVRPTPHQVNSSMAQAEHDECRARRSTSRRAAVVARQGCPTRNRRR